MKNNSRKRKKKKTTNFSKPKNVKKIIIGIWVGHCGWAGISKKNQEDKLIVATIFFLLFFDQKFRWKKKTKKTQKKKEEKKIIKNVWFFKNYYLQSVTPTTLYTRYPPQTLTKCSQGFFLSVNPLPHLKFEWKVTEKETFFICPNCSHLPMAKLICTTGVGLFIDMQRLVSFVISCTYV